MRYLIARRIIALGILALFSFKAFDFILEGNLSSSKLFKILPLSDPFATLQIILASLSIDLVALTGALIVLFIYGLLLGPVFCSWVCPVNLITDFAAFIRAKLALKNKFLVLPKNLRYFVLVLVLILSFVLSLPVFESFSYIAIIHRGIIFATSSWFFVAFILFCIDAFLSPRAICSHFCPLGAFYAFISRFALLKVKYDKQRCTQCYKCIQICPQKQVLWMIGKESASVSSGECIRCARCIELCDDDALNFNICNLRKKR